MRWHAWSYGVDLGTFAQVVDNAFRGFTDRPEAGTHFRFHWSPILAVLWPVVALTRSPLCLQFVQAILVALTAVPLAAIVRTYAGDAWSFRVALLALIYPPLLAAAFLEFHELAFYPVLALSLVWAADRARWGWFALFAFGAILVREDATLDLAIVGVVFAIIGLVKRKRSTGEGLLAGQPREPQRLTIAGFGLGAASLAVLAGYFTWAQHSGGWRPSVFYDYPFAHGPLQAALAVFTHPLALVRAVFTFGRFTYLLEAFLPLALLPLLTRWTWLALPALAGVLLASMEMVWRMGYQYPLLWAPWLLLASAWALVRLRESRGERVARRWWIAAVSICAVVLVAFDPMHPLHYLRKEPYQHSADAVKAFACVPRDAYVATHDQWYTEYSLAYPHITKLDSSFARYNDYVVYEPDWQNAYVDDRLLPELAAAQSSGRFRVICRAGDVVVLKRASGARTP